MRRQEVGRHKRSIGRHLLIKCSFIHRAARRAGSA